MASMRRSSSRSRSCAITVQWSQQWQWQWQWRVFVFVMMLVSCSAGASSTTQQQLVPHEEVAALSALHHSTRGDSWLWRSEQDAGAIWNFTLDDAGGFTDNPCSSSSPAAPGSAWQGIVCSNTPVECASQTQTCHISEIVLASYGLRGAIPAVINNLTALEVLNFFNNHVTGTIPQELGDLTSLNFVSMYMNSLSGTIPPEIGQLHALSVLELDANPLVSGSLPLELGNLSRLVSLYIGVNRVTGTIPVEVGKLTALEQLFLYSSLLTGTIPSKVGLLTALKSFYLEGNQLTGTIPPEVGLLTALENFYLDLNQLTGPIPGEVRHLTSVSMFAIDDNFLTGSIPREIWQLTSLKRITLRNNSLTGTFPGESTLATNLDVFILSHNLLSGTIPNEVGQLTVLEYLGVSNNILTGTIPGDMGKLTTLLSISLRNNLLTGTIPVLMGRLVALEVLYLHENALSGTIPLEMGQLFALEQLSLQNNHFTGSIPSSVGNLVSLEELWLHDNRLSGGLPFEMSRMASLRNVFVQNNRMTGDLEVAFNHSIQLQLTTIDASNNLLSGVFPSEVFLLPQLQVLALSVNCFKKKLSNNICRATQLEVLSMNGLQASEECEERIVLPFSGVSIFNTIGGKVPLCLWVMQNLTVLHLTGNGLTGSLVGSLPEYSQLADLSLSHNKLSGTISSEILSVATLDLSFNQFVGEYDDGSHYTYSSTQHLEVNRLSGRLPKSELEHIINGSLNILRGNMFSCGAIPKTDEYSRDYVCGSRNLDDSLYVFVGAFALTIITLFMLVWWARGTASVNCNVQNSSGALMWTYFTFSRTLDNRRWNSKLLPDIRKIVSLCNSFVEVMFNGVLLLVVILTGSATLYVVKALDSNNKYTTHSHTYSWFWTVAYMRGVVPAGLLLLVWILAMFSSFYRVLAYRRVNGDVVRQEDKIAIATISAAANAEKTAFRYYKLTEVGSAFFINICVTLSVNGLYIYTTQQSFGAVTQFLCQLSLSIFRLMYSAIVFPLLSKPIRNEALNIKFRFLVLSINNLLIPCIVTALTSAACFQGLLVLADEVVTPYTYRACLSHHTSVSTGLTACTTYEPEEVESAPLVPPFTYNNQCGSVLLTSYIPVFLLGYSIQILLPAIVLVLSAHSPYKSIPPLIHDMLHGLLWPKQWIECGDEFVRNMYIVDHCPDCMMKCRSILCNDVLNNWLLLLTFGLCSPVLAVAIVTCVVLKMSIWVIAVGRFTRCVLDDEGDDDSKEKYISDAQTPSTCRSSISVVAKGREAITSFALHSLAKLYIPLFTVLAGSFWRLAWCSALFVAMLAWDLAADEVGWLQSLWAPTLPFIVMIVLQTINFLNNMGRYSQQLESNNEKPTPLTESDRDIVDREPQNPLHISTFILSNQSL